MAEQASNRSNMLLVGLVAGLAGAGIGLLVAPRSGKETREQLKQNARDMKEKANRGLDTAKMQMNKGMEKSKQATSRVAHLIKRTADDVSDEAAMTDQQMPAM